MCVVLSSGILIVEVLSPHDARIRIIRILKGMRAEIIAALCAMEKDKLAAVL